ncbi:MAG: heme-dependent oxidative N-demethylase family protein [Gemmobacter sp.]
MDPVLHHTLPQARWMHPALARLPGMLPVAPGDWLRVDEAFAGQMALRDDLILHRPGDVLALLPEGAAAAGELLDRVLAEVARMASYRVGADAVVRPDGASVPVDRSAPLASAGRLVQCDLCLLERPPGAAEHRMTGAVLCFPASWTLAQKIGRPLTAIHDPVAEYGAGLAARVQRLFDALRPEAPLWRMNALAYADPTLHQPRREGEARAPGPRRFLRSERQCLVRLPRTGAVVFSIHTYVLPIDTLTEPARQRFLAQGHGA